MNDTNYSLIMPVLTPKSLCVLLALDADEPLSDLPLLEPWYTDEFGDRRLLWLHSGLRSFSSTPSMTLGDNLIGVAVTLSFETADPGFKSFTFSIFSIGRIFFLGNSNLWRTSGYRNDQQQTNLNLYQLSVYSWVFHWVNCKKCMWLCKMFSLFNAHLIMY